MTRLALLRHAPTEWNQQGRVQGSSDVALSDAGREAVASWHLPPAIEKWRRVTSPLSRCRETASLLRPEADVQIEPRLIEMNWGEWEGRRLADLRAELGDDMIAREVLGLDFHAPGGESPREVQTRVKPWLAEIGAAGIDTLAITHKGVVRAIYALATGWTMQAREPDRLRFPAIHLVRVEPDGTLAPDRFNLPLNGRADRFA
ncbi:MAG: histidine phosphatase family protein [Dongiaceae bacterium]